MSSVTEKLEAVHMDLYGPVPVPSLQDKRNMLTITDQKTGRIWGVLSREQETYCAKNQGLVDRSRERMPQIFEGREVSKISI